MRDSHLVSTCRIDIVYNREEKARALQFKVSQIFHSALKPVILEALDETDSDDTVWSIDVLEVDLGEISEEELDRELVRRLKDKLGEALGKLGLVKGTALPATTTTIRNPTAQERYSDALETFLLSGYIPWPYRSITTSYGTFIDTMLTEYSAALVTLIRRNIVNRIFLERLVKQFGPANMERVVQILAPGEAAVVVETVRKIQWLEVKERILSIPRESFEYSVWELALLYIVRDRGTRFNNKDFIRSLIKGLASRHNVDFVLYLHQIHRAVQYLALYQTFKYAFPALLEELYTESLGDADAMRPEPRDARNNEQALYFYLEHGYLIGKHVFFSKSDLAATIGQGEGQESIPRITMFLQKHIAHDEIRFRTMSLLREEGSKQVVAYVEPANSGFVFDFADKLQHEQERGELGVRADSKTFGLMKWDFIIYTLLNNRGSVFNTKVFILGTIRAMANRYGQDFDDLLRLVLNSVPVGPSINQGTNLLPALRLIKDEYDKASEFTAAKQTKATSDAAQLAKVIFTEIDRLFDASGSQQRSISGELYILLTRLFTMPATVISRELRQLLTSWEFGQHIMFTTAEREALRIIAPGWFHAIYDGAWRNPSEESGTGREAFLALLQYYATDGSLPWWANEGEAKKYGIDHVVLALLKHRSSHTKDQLVLLLMDRKKRKVLLNGLADTTMALLARQLSNIQDTTLEYYLDLVKRVKTEKHFLPGNGTSFNVARWDIVLDALLQDRGSRFNLKAFLKTTLGRLANHFNMAYSDMLRVVNDLVGRGGGKEKDVFKSLLNELAAEVIDEGENEAVVVPRERTDGDDAVQELAPFWQRLLQNLKALNDVRADTRILNEIKMLLQQTHSERGADLLHTFMLLEWSAQEWARLWSLLEDALLARVFDILIADLPFIRGYLADWERIAHQLFPQRGSPARRRFYELTLTYVILNHTVERHRWFAFVLSGFESLFDSKRDLDKKLTRYFKAAGDMTNSTIRLSFKKWKRGSADNEVNVSEEKRNAEVAGRAKLKTAIREATYDPDTRDEKDSASDYWILNCGLTLIWPFMERYFTLLDLLEQRQFKSPEAAYRGVHLLQYLASGKEGYPEYQLVLNKILCGVKTAKPVVKDLVLTDKEKALSEDLLKGVIQNWSILGNTSVEGLRTTFLMREGLLKKGMDSDQLHVERKAFDVLIDKIPWSYQTVKMPWMERAIHVLWR